MAADEPTGNLDSKNSDTIVELIEELHATGGTIVVITHNLEIAESFPRPLQAASRCLTSSQLSVIVMPVLLITQQSLPLLPLSSARFP